MANKLDGRTLSGRLEESKLFGPQYTSNATGRVSKSRRLLGTDYILGIIESMAGLQIVWYKQEPNHWNICDVLTIDEVLQSIPVHIQEEILFNIDLFR